MGRITAYAIADTLIAAGIGDVSSHRVFIGKDGIVKQIYSGEEVEQIERYYVDYIHEQDEIIKDYKRRAVVAEKAGRIIQRDMARVFDVSNPRICELIANIWDLAKKQAEKELAEEGKDD